LKHILTSNKQIKKQRYVIYTCDPGCSGFADRVKGII